MKIISFSIVIFALYIFFKVKWILVKPNLENTWWKVDILEIKDTSIKPFKINISDMVLRDLNERLDKVIPFQKSLKKVKQHYGINDVVLNNVIDFWKNNYNWRRREELLNKYPQFKTNIQGINIHYVHVKPKHTKGYKVLTLLLLHGWPGSVKEFYEVISPLTTPIKGQTIIFELIIPSLPGYGFSEAAEIPGLSTPQLAVIFKNLMGRLGFAKFYIHGSDWGAFIVSHMAALFPEKVTGMHSTICWINTPWAFLKLSLYSLFPSLIVEESNKDLVYPMSSRYDFLFKESGYMHLQGTKPDTIGVALRDSPIGFAAYILEKFITWTNSSWLDLEDGGLTNKFKMEDLLDNVMIYWVTGSITTSMRLYKEYFKHIFLSLEIDSLPIEIPSGCSRFKNELLWIPELILKSRYKNLVYLGTHEDGGHFAGFEMPQLLAEDIMKFAEKVEELKNKF